MGMRVLEIAPVDIRAPERHSLMMVRATGVLVEHRRML